MSTAIFSPTPGFAQHFAAAPVTSRGRVPPSPLPLPRPDFWANAAGVTLRVAAAGLITSGQIWLFLAS